MAKSFFPTFTCEVLARHRFRLQAEAGITVFSYIKALSNPRHRHSTLSYCSPAVYE